MNTNETILDSNIGGEDGAPSVQNYASTGQRFANYIIDLIAFFIIVIALAIPFVISESDESFFDHPLSNVFSYGLFFAYYTIMEASTGRTLGKYITRTQVVNKEGMRPDAKTIALRSLIRLIPFEAFTAFSSSGLMWHDKWTDTYVVKSN